ncbi:WLM domain-containing protein [Gaertneriomyces semiglobifer]|nr:WLM domain-containing protein [Gaertneriomyces semiglobifer]
MVVTMQTAGAELDGNDSATDRNDLVTFSVSFRKVMLSVTLPGATTVSEMKAHLSNLPEIAIPPTALKLTLRGKANFPADATLRDVGVTSGTKILVLGSSQQEVDYVKRKDEAVKWQLEDQKRLKRAPPGFGGSESRVRSLSDQTADEYTFLDIRPLDEFTDKSKAYDVLCKLRDDPAIKNIMTTRKWSVGALIELHPRQRTILGYNQNKGQIIALRLRTDDLDGFRYYDDVRRVLLHELSHMVWSEHDERFHSLNRELNADVVKHEKSGRTIGPKVRRYEPREEELVDSGGFVGGTFVLGGRGLDGRDRREAAAEAALRRLNGAQGGSR